MQPTWTVTVDDVLDGLFGRVPADPALLIGSVLRAWGAELVRAMVIDADVTHA